MDAAVSIQRVVRGYLSRRRISTERQERESGSRGEALPITAYLIEHFFAFE